ncbi:hypothetical protein BV898_05463 [Hypsibius exemplaris]|uniref:G-protein coupled receptors family 1 profile domain-containing protein n=1 Tax=Hypsibius exemplaris TaxID=2072580 RepID=A0A1W0WZK0_HYPEX|nr:hypothetical protein BV898_05463 [Hypsibius exemplaris]
MFQNLVTLVAVASFVLLVPPKVAFASPDVDAKASPPSGSTCSDKACNARKAEVAAEEQRLTKLHAEVAARDPEGCYDSRLLYNSTHQWCMHKNKDCSGDLAATVYCEHCATIDGQWCNKSDLVQIEACLVHCNAYLVGHPPGGSILGNAVVLLLLLTNRRLRRASFNVYVINLMSANLLIALVRHPMLVL